MSRFRLPVWLVRGTQAGVFSALLAGGPLLGYQMTSAAPSPLALPTGPAAVFLLALPVLAMGAIAVAYPVGMAPTRTDALLGAAVGFLVAADLVALGIRVAVRLDGLDAVVPLGLATAVVAAPSAVVGVTVSQLASPLGFGTRAGAWAAGTAALIALPMLVLATRIG